MQHLDEGTIHAWLDGALDAEEAQRVEQHAAACAACAAAVAEARGLAAGASRILASLDNVPGGVIPSSMPSAESTPIAVHRSRSLWNTLHLTPGRAAAAAIVFLAAGTALVLRQKPNEPVTQPYTLVARDTSQRVMAAAPTSANGSPAVPKTAARPARPMASALAAPTERREVQSDMATVAAAQSQPRVADSISVAAIPRRATDAESKVATAAPTPAPRAEDAVKNPPAGVGGVPAVVAGAAPRAARAKSFMSQLTTRAPVSVHTSAAGCYSVESDSLPMLPRRIMLDTSNAAVAVDALQERAARNLVVAERHGIRAIVGDSTFPIASWHWSARPGGIRLEMSTPSGAAAQLDSISASGDLRGALDLNGRPLAVVLRRVECP